MSKWLVLILILLPTNSLTREQIKVGIIDSGLDLTDTRFSAYLCKSGHLDYTGEGIEDLNGHGTHIAGLIMQHAKNANYCLVILKYYSKFASNRANAENFTYALTEAARQKLKIVNISGGGPVPVAQEYFIIKINPSILFFVSVGNEGENLDIPKYKFYPASYDLDNIITVGNWTPGADGKTFGHRAYTSNWGKVVKVWQEGNDVMSFAPKKGLKVMSGTSMSTAIATGKYIYENYR